MRTLTQPHAGHSAERTQDAKGLAAAVADGDTVQVVEMATAKSPGNETVLVVDDEPLLRELMSDILRSLGYRVLEASGGLEAQRLIGADEKINLLLTDFSMPETNGLELARWLQREYPAVKVLITTGAVRELLDQVGEHEWLAVLPKPFDGVQLGRMIRLLLG
jgi:CheY-like chemotaxis protein